MKELIAPPSARVEKITPDAAHDLLQGNKNNRRLREHRIRYYAELIARGAFVLTGDAICVTACGRLLNGQHRLLAVVNAGKAAYFVVLRNCPEESFAAMDQGSQRTMGDLFRSNRIAYPNECAAISRMLWHWFDGGTPGAKVGGRNQVNPADLEKTYLQYEEEIREAVVFGKLLSKLYPASRIGLVDVMLRLVHGEAVSEWWGLVDPECPKGLDKGHPARTLRDHLLLSEESRRMPHTEFASKAIRCFNAWAEGRDMDKVGYRESDPFPEITRKVLATCR